MGKAKKKFVGSAAPKSVKGVNVIDDGVPTAIKKQEENWSEYELEDGNKLRIKPLVMEVRKSRLPDAAGNQQYHVRSTIIIDVQKSK